MISSKEMGGIFAEKGLWTNTLKSDTNSIYVLAQILVQRGFPVSISQIATDVNGNILSDTVAIYARLEGLSALNKVSDTPERRALYQATSPISGFGEPIVDECEWDDETKIRVKAFYWQNRMKHYQKYAKKFKADKKEFEAEVKKSWAEVVKLGRPIPLTPDNIRSILEEVVDRELASSKP